MTLGVNIIDKETNISLNKNGSSIDLPTFNADGILVFKDVFKKMYMLKI